MVAMNRIGVEVVNTAEISAHANRPVDRGSGNAQYFLDLIHQFNRVTGVSVEFIDKRHDGCVPEAADFHQLNGPVLDALGTVDHHECRIHCRERPISVL